MADMSAGMSGMANKQYGITRQAVTKPYVESKSDGRGNLAEGDIAEMSNPTAEYFAALEDVNKKKKINDSSVEDLKKRLEKMLVEKHDNSHNMLAEAFSGFKAGICQAVLTLKGAEFSEIREIQKRALNTARKNVHLGFERLAMACAEFEVYVS